MRNAECRMLFLHCAFSITHSAFYILKPEPYSCLDLLVGPLILLIDIIDIL
jgi:hypothetical protein